MKNIQAKKIPKLRFPEFRDEWQEKNLGEITKIYDGTHQTPKYKEKGIPFYSVEQITSNNFSDTKYIAWEVYEKEKKRVKIERNDILITRIGDIGTSKLIDWDVQASFYVSLALIKTKEEITSSFLNQYIKTDSFQRELWRRTIHVAFPKKINLGEISHCIIQLPKINEQQKIADFLTAIDEKIEGIKKEKELLEKYKKGMMQKIFSQEVRFKDENGKNYPDWEEKKLRKLVSITTGKLDANAMIENGKYKFFTCAKETYFIDQYAFNAEALLVSGNGAHVGYIHYYKGKFNAYQRTYVLTDFMKNIFFIKYFLEKNLPKRIFAEKKESNTPYITLSTLEDMPINIPKNEKEQQKIADFLTALDNKITLIDKKLEQAQKFKKALLQQMFV